MMATRLSQHVTPDDPAFVDCKLLSTTLGEASIKGRFYELNLRAENLVQRPFIWTNSNRLAPGHSTTLSYSVADAVAA